jgi:creatinine amidohydrolase/Fe(II)-dependent formamide hydrolase-like protein
LKTSAALLVLLALVAAPALAQTPDTVFLEELTWPELRALVAAGKTTIILPIGGTEQNGPHMALGKHNTRVRALSERIARVLGNALVGPVIAYVPEGGLSPRRTSHAFPGTITVPETSSRRSLESAARRRAPPRLPQRRVSRRPRLDPGRREGRGRKAQPRMATTARAHHRRGVLPGGHRGIPRAAAGPWLSTRELGEHAAVPDTSLTLALDPKLVRKDPPADAQVAGAGTGVDGDPRRASAELGVLGVDLIVTRTVAAIKASTDRH